MQLEVGWVWIVEFNISLTLSLGWNGWRARRDLADPSASHFGTVGETWFVPDWGWSDNILVDWPWCCTTAHNGRLQPSKFRSATWRQGGHLVVMRVAFSMLLINLLRSDDTSCSWQWLFTAGQRHHSEQRRFTIPISMLSKRTASPLWGSGPLAASFKIVPMFYRAIDSSLDNSMTRSTEPIITESASARREVWAELLCAFSYFITSGVRTWRQHHSGNHSFLTICRSGCSCSLIWLSWRC
jgi:hypothetical protein